MKKKKSLEQYFETTTAKVVYIIQAAVAIELIIAFIVFKFGGRGSYGLGATLILIGLGAFLASFLYREAKVIKDDDYDEFFKKKINDLAFDHETREYDHESRSTIYVFEDYCPGKLHLIRKGKNGHPRTDKYTKTKIICFKDKIVINYFESTIDGASDFKFYEFEKGSVKFIHNIVDEQGFKFETLTLSENGNDIFTFPVPKNNYDVEELTKF